MNEWRATLTATNLLYENEAWLVLRVASCGGGESGRGHTAHRSPDTRTEGYTVVTRDTGPARATATLRKTKRSKDTHIWYV